MKKLFILLLPIVFCSIINAQTIKETVGSGTGTQTIAATVFSTAYAFSGTADTRVTSVSSGYTGASGGKNVFMTNSGTSTFQMTNINTLGCSAVSLQFGIWKNSANTAPLTTAAFIVEYSVGNGGSWTPLAWGGHSLGAVWTQSASVSLPNDLLTIRFRNTSTTVQARLDDITIIGTGPCNNALLLPIVLEHFKADKNLLLFRTASESNNSHFLIERSANGKDFSAIGRVEGHGTTQTVQNYEFLDKTPLQGTNYYRLKQIDFDERFEYSKILSVYFGQKNLDVSISSATNDFIKLNIFSQNEDDANISIVDMNGRIVSVQNVILNAKENQIDISNSLQNGMYIVKINTNSGEQASKVLNIR